ncbi:3'-5' exoribonuclease [Candidatus Pacearchaeota archaeon]|nr:3'-5' exoribonuclease [Candidatus Pacearchaeota archaeon]
MAKPEIYVVTDIESDGPIPGVFSMLSFASVAVDADGINHGEFEANLELLPDAKQNPDTMKFWDNNQKAYQATRVNMQDPAQAMRKYAHWLKSLPGRPIFTGFPAGFDFTFVYWYMIRYCGFDGNPYGFSCLDMKTMAMCLMKSKFTRATKRNMPKRWFGPKKHTHVAIDDAREQADLFIGMLNDFYDTD